MADIATDEDVRAFRARVTEARQEGFGLIDCDPDDLAKLLARLDAKPARPEMVVPIGYVCIPMYAVGSDEERCERLSAVFGDKFTRYIADGILDGDQGVTNDFCNLLLAALAAGEAKPAEQDFLDEACDNATGDWSERLPTILEAAWKDTVRSACQKHGHSFVPDGWWYRCRHCDYRVCGRS